MRKRIELSPEHSSLHVPGRVLNELCAHALETQPEECCGLVTGSETEPFLSVYRCRNEMTVKHKADPQNYPRDGREAFLMNDLDLQKSQQDAESRGQRVMAIYHSHVGAGAYLSEMDQEFADHELFPFPDAAQIVVAVWAERVSRVGIFERDAETGEYHGRAVEAEIA